MARVTTESFQIGIVHLPENSSAVGAVVGNLAVVLEQQTELQPTEIMTDTGAYTDVVFGLFWLLGYRFCPRIADIGGARYWRIDPSADYGLLNGIANHRINTKLIEENWDDLLRLAGSLKLGMVQATSIMKTLRN